MAKTSPTKLLQILNVPKRYKFPSNWLILHSESDEIVEFRSSLEFSIQLKSLNLVLSV